MKVSSKLDQILRGSGKKVVVYYGMTLIYIKYKYVNQNAVVVVSVPSRVLVCLNMIFAYKNLTEGDLGKIMP